MTATLSEAESGPSCAAAFAILPGNPLDIISDRGNLVHMLMSGNDHIIMNGTTTGVIATTAITANLAPDSSLGSTEDGGLFAIIGGELVACIYHSGTGVTFFSSTDGGVTWADEGVDIPSANGPQGVAVYPDIDRQVVCRN